MSEVALGRTGSGRGLEEPNIRVVHVVTGIGRTRYVVVDDQGVLVESITRYLKYLDLCGKARNTLRTYARSLAFYFTFLKQKGLTHEQVQIADLAAFVHWLKRRMRQREPALRSRPGRIGR